jgi:hypothetical protein
MDDGSILEDMEEDAPMQWRQLLGHELCRRWTRAGKENLDVRDVGKEKSKGKVCAYALITKYSPSPTN